MKYKDLCSKCADNPDNFLPGEVYNMVSPEECPRCKERWTVRLAMTSWLMVVFGSAITVLYMLQVSHGFSERIGVPVEVCNYAWILGIILALWFLTSTAGKFLARKAGMIEETTNTKEWDL